MGDVKNARTDIAFADLYLIPSRKQHIEYIYPHDNDYVCFLVAKPPLNPKWMDLAIPFQKEAWFAILATLILVSIIVSLVVFLTQEFQPRDTFWNLCAFFLDESMPFTHKIKSTPLRQRKLNLSSTLLSRFSLHSCSKI